MECFRLVYRLLTPIVLGEFPITLDALVYAALFARSADEQWSRAQLGHYFLLSGGVPHASALVFGRTRQYSVIARTVPVIGGLRSAVDFSAAVIQPFGRNGGYSKIKTEGGPYKFRSDTYRGYWAPFISFDFFGHPDRIEKLLANFLIGIGARAQIGAGQISMPRFQRIERDMSLIDDANKPARPLPIELYESLTGLEGRNAVIARTGPPYWRAGDGLAVMPERVRIENY